MKTDGKISSRPYFYIYLARFRPQPGTTAGLAAAAGHPSIPAGNGTPPQPENPNP